jgi:NTE family protein
VYAPLLRTTFTRTVEQFTLGAVLNRGKGTTSLLDTGPLRHTAEWLLDTDQLARNVAAGTPEAVGVIATRVPPAANSDDGTASGRSVLFLHEQHPVTHPGDPDRAQDVMSCPLRHEHVLASAAIPVAFPAVRVTDPTAAAGWYIDGGVRLNTPLRPAVALGATRIIIISANSTVYGAPPPPGATSSPPDVADAAGQILHAVLADRLVEDLRQLRARNHLLAQVRALPGGTPMALRRTDGTPYRTIEYMTVAPGPGELGRLSARVLADKTRGFGAVREQDNYLLGRLLRGAGDGPGRRELLSYFFFDEDYFAESIKCGHRAALDALAAGWQT